MTYSIRDEYKPRFGRQVLTLWSGSFCSEYEGEAVERPGHTGFIVSIGGNKTKVTCAAPRDESNYIAVDDAINAALTADRHTLTESLE